MSSPQAEPEKAGYPALAMQEIPKEEKAQEKGDQETHLDIVEARLAVVVRDPTKHKSHELSMPSVNGFEQVSMQDLKKGEFEEEEDEDDLSDFDLEKDDLEDKERAFKEANILEKAVLYLQQGVIKVYQLLKKLTKGYLFTLVFLALFAAYFIVAMDYEFGDEGSHRLLGCTILGIVIWAYPYIKQFVLSMIKKVYGDDKLSDDHAELWRKTKKVIQWVMYAVMTAIMVYMCVDEAREKPENLRSVPGLAAFILIALLFSTRPSKIQWHTIFWSVALQFLCAVYVLKWKFGKDSIIWVQDRFTEFYQNADEGSRLAFGETYADHVMIFKAVPLALFSNAMFTVLYYLGVMQFIIRFIGNILKFFLRVSHIEVMSVSASIFVEGLAGTMMMRPFLAKLTKSQMFTVVTGGITSMGGAYLAILAAFGVSLEFLVPAMLISAPATFAICKVMVPEVRDLDDEENSGEDIGADERVKYLNVFDAAQTGALSMLPVMGNVIVIAYTFFSGVTWVNHTLGWFGDRVGIEGFSIELISSYLLYPVALAMGVEFEDCRRVAMLLGYRIGLYNIFAFLKLTELKINKGIYFKYMLETNYTGTITTHRDDITLDAWDMTLKNGYLSDRSEAIATYCLCGFSSFISAALILGIIYTLVPKRKMWVNSAALPAILAGNLANCMTGCFASLFY